MLTLIMSPVRALPSIEQTLERGAVRKDSVTMPERSEANAKETTQSYSKDQQSPLAHNGNNQSKPGITFAAQDQLPKLPIPDLDQTCKKYLASLEPLQTPREHQESERAVDEFLRTDGPDLQEKLKRYSAGKSSYIEQFCESADAGDHRFELG
jgi:carnitine O-acetyltransferase